MAHSRRRLLAAVAMAVPAVAVGAALPAPAAAAAVDPHPAWLAEWSALMTRVNTRGFTLGRDLRDTPEWRRIGELEDLIADTPARTVAGAAAQVRFAYESEADAGGLDGTSVGALEGALAVLERAAGADAAGLRPFSRRPPVAAVAVPAAPHPDARLLALGRRLEASWAREDAAGEAEDERAAAYAASGALVDRIGAAGPARTPAGLRVKARAVLWLRGDSPTEVSEDMAGSVEIASSIVRDLVAMGPA